MKIAIRSAAIALLLIMAGSVPMVAQSCALCYTQAASAGAKMIEALRSGILVLIVPPTLMSFGVAAVAYRRRNQFRHIPSEEQDMKGPSYTPHD